MMDMDYFQTMEKLNVKNVQLVIVELAFLIIMELRIAKNA